LKRNIHTIFQLLIAFLLTPKMKLTFIASFKMIL
jgi:hypothetical protein